MKKLIFIFCILCLVILTGCNSSVYTVEFIVDEEVIDTQQVKHGKAAVPPSDPEKEGYVFTGWDKDYKNVKENLKVNAIFEKEEYKVIFYDENDNILKEEIVKYKESANAPTAPEKEGYVFSRWDEDITSVTEDLEVYPKYEKIKYTVIFQNEDGSLIKETKVEHGENAINPSAPKKTGYTFIGWDKDYKNVTSDLVITAQYELTVFTITYIVDGEKVNLEPSSYTILSDASIDLPNVIEKEGFECLGWHQGNTRVVTFFSADAEDKVFELKYLELDKPLEIPSDMKYMFSGIKVVKNSVTGKDNYQPIFPAEYSASVTKFTWSSLNTDIVTVSAYSTLSPAASGYAIIRAELIDDPTIVIYGVVKVADGAVYISTIEEANKIVEYEVTFTDENGNVIDTQLVREGGEAKAPTPPTKDGYTFYGWSENHFNIKENITLEPTYIEGVSNFAGKTVSILSDSISTYKGYIPDGYKYFYPDPASKLTGYNDTWWMQTINKLGMKLLKNNSYAGSCVSSGTGDSATVNDGRLKELLFGTEKPDIILIFIGNNDCGSKYVSLNTFDSSYKIMIEKIQKLCPESELYILTLPTLVMFPEGEKEKYNDVIRKYANEFELPIIEMKDTFTDENVRDYLVDSAHPNKAGMDKFAADVIKGLLASKGITEQ